ncbi:hypothetical protein [Pseudonocardia sp.]|uniref:hypothetical protein n=1 Tax=Pseudonocardia sp. TaxID=60912 RepID=UPI002624F143|nr:hypothetical protein [Pseudonocardia sp.]
MTAVAALVGPVVLGVLLLVAATLRRVDDEVRLLGLACRAARRDAERAATVEAVEEARRVEEAVEAGTSGVRDVHRAIADVPFGILGALPPTRAASEAVRQVHDRTADGVYGAVSAVNRAAGAVLRALRGRGGRSDGR